MADAVISVALQKLSNLLIREAVFLSEVRDQMEELRNELKWMLCFLKDADTKQEQDERIREWVSEVRDIAYTSEDLIDTFILQIENNKTQNRRRGFRASIKNYTCFLVNNNCFHFHRFGKEIQTIQTRLNNISTKRDIYGIRNLGDGGEVGGTSSAGERLRLARRTSPYANDEEDFIGMEDAIKALMSQLINEEEPRRCVISIVGMGGLGKTSLAKKIYNHTIVKQHFTSCAWIYVSQEYNTKDLLQRILKSFITPTTEEFLLMKRLTEDDLEQWLYDLLKKRHYLVVIDDVWHPEAWESLKRAFPDKSNGSRVLLTTRNRNVAVSADVRSVPHELRFLSEEESWELFCKKAFPSNGTEINGCPPSLEKMGRDMLERCGGLPLGIVVLGGLLSKKRPSTHEWQRVLDHISRHLTKDQDRISQILTLSYIDLPFWLKSCFLYIGLFPEDYVIETERLIRLWVAEGFIPQQQESMEDVAEDYLNELIDRSLIIRVKGKDSSKFAKACSIHDLLRDLCISKAKEESFLDIHGEIESAQSFLDIHGEIESAQLRPRRLAIHSNVEGYFTTLLYLRSLLFLMRNLRSVLFFIRNERVQVPQLKIIFVRFKLLRVLDLENVWISERLPRQIGEMIHLRYLGLRNAGVQELPSSIGNLKSLQTLDFRAENMCILPNVLWKMKQLRHICGRWNCTTKQLRINTLTNLQTLDYIPADHWMKNNSIHLVNLRELGMVEVSSSQGQALFESLDGLRRLQSLSLRIMASSVPSSPLLVQFSQCRHHLLHLKLNGVATLPDDLYQLLPNLLHLSISRCRLKKDQLETLGKLQHLTTLLLITDAYIEKQMICSTNEFPRLEILHLAQLHELEEWNVEEGAMSKLKSLMIIGCRKLKMVPEELKFMKSLKEIVVKDMPTEFKDRLRGEDSYKVLHVPSFTIR